MEHQSQCVSVCVCVSLTDLLISVLPNPKGHHLTAARSVGSFDTLTLLVHVCYNLPTESYLLTLMMKMMMRISGCEKKLHSISCAPLFHIWPSRRAANRLTSLQAQRSSTFTHPELDDTEETPPITVTGLSLPSEFDQYKTRDDDED